MTKDILRLDRDPSDRRSICRTTQHFGGEFLNDNTSLQSGPDPMCLYRTPAGSQILHKPIELVLKNGPCLLSTSCTTFSKYLVNYHGNFSKIVREHRNAHTFVYHRLEVVLFGFFSVIIRHGVLSKLKNFAYFSWND